MMDTTTQRLTAAVSHRSLRPRRLVMAALVLVLPTMAASAQTAASTQPDRSTNNGRGLIVDAAELPALMQKPNVVVLDARPRKAFREGHLAGARHVPIERWRTLSEEGLDDRDAWRPALAALGIDPARDHVLVYDDGGYTQAARIAFILQHFGARHVALINGAWPAIETLGKARKVAITDAESPTTQPVGWPAEAAGGSLSLAEKADVLKAMGGDTQILDVRTDEEFAGEVVKYDQPRLGHIPGAVHVPHTVLIEDGRIKSARQIREIFERAGLDFDKPIVAHCASGSRSALVAIALKHAGHRDVGNYLASFTEWSKDADCPVVWPEAASKPQVPEHWKPVDSSFPGTVAKYDAGKAEVSLTRLAGRAGGVLPNVNRWRRQVGLPPVAEVPGETVTVAGNDATLVVLEGSERSIVGAILPLDGESWFFKLSGPSAAVKAETDNLRNWMTSLESLPKAD